jgi:hypothetical protein
MGQLFGAISEPHVPTYRAAAAFLEREKGSGAALFGWTIARIVMIAPPMALVGVPWGQAFAGAAIASVLISVFATLRLFDAERTGLNGKIHRKCLVSKARK